ncbi:MAG: class I SAM-dependent methyltransferase, partial [Pseudomonadales bacterium]
NTDKELEYQRYNERAFSQLSNKNGDFTVISGSASLQPSIQAPYRYFESKIRELSPGSDGRILEIGAGTGAFTKILLSTGANVLATDISEHSLDVIQKNLKSPKNLQIEVADMESLTFDNESFDVVTSAGSLSYGDNSVVMNEIYRVLKKGGFFICVDSLNHNPIYRLNRWLHFLKKNRTLSTLKRMPTMSLIDAYQNKFGESNAYYFGSIIWLTPLLEKVTNQFKAAEIVNKFDKLINTKNSAFKFVMVAKK